MLALRTGIEPVSAVPETAVLSVERSKRDESGAGICSRILETMRESLYLYSPEKTRDKGNSTSVVKRCT